MLSIELESSISSLINTTKSELKIEFSTLIQFCACMCSVLNLFVPVAHPQERLWSVLIEQHRNCDMEQV